MERSAYNILSSEIINGIPMFSELNTIELSIMMKSDFVLNILLKCIGDYRYTINIIITFPLYDERSASRVRKYLCYVNYL